MISEEEVERLVESFRELAERNREAADGSYQRGAAIAYEDVANYLEYEYLSNDE